MGIRVGRSHRRDRAIGFVRPHHQPGLGQASACEGSSGGGDRRGDLDELERVVVEKVADTVAWLAHRRYWIEGRGILIYVGSTSGKATRWQAPFLAERLGLPLVVR